jgi:AraC family transcriptional regulator of adaptative response/methylated-DNA-[protein]-cysteine methyltransferase
MAAEGGGIVSSMTDTERIHDVCRYIEERSSATLRVNALAKRAAMSRYHFARRFKAVVGVTPKQYLADARMRAFKAGLKSKKGIAAALYDAGYGSPSRVYEHAAQRLGMTPAQYRAAGEGVAISYAFLETPVGLMLVGATDRGICFAQFDESEEALAMRLRAEYPRAEIAPMREPRHPDFARWIAAIAQHLDGAPPHEALPLDIRATAFQMRVWRYLQSIPYGDVQSYGEVAAGIGAPKAARAVGHACSLNPVAVIVPCHRVIRESGHLGCYRWGLERKRALVDRERARKHA